MPYAEHAKTSDTTLAVTGTAARVPYFSTGTTLGNSPLYVSGSFVGIGDPTPAYALDVTGTVHSTLNLRADQDAIVVGDVTAGGNVNGVGGTFSGNVSVTGNATVNGGKGLIRAPTGTQLKYYTREAAFAFSLAAGATVSGSIGFGAFTTPPKVWMGNIVTGTGDFSKVMITLYNVGTNSCDIRFYNPGSATVTLDATWQFMAIGE